MRKIKRILAVVTVSAALICGLSGCAQTNVINRRAIVQAIDLDWEDGKFIATLEYFSPMGGGDQPINLTASNSEITTGEGITISNAISNAALPKGKEPFYAQSSIVVIGRELAETGLDKVADFINFDIDLRVNTEMYIADNKASDIISKNVDLGVLPGETMERIQEIYSTGGMMFSIEYYQFINYFYSPYLSAGLPLITAVPKEEAEKGKEGSDQESIPKNELAYLGTEIIKGKKASGSLDLEETRGALFLTDRVDTTNIDTVLPNEEPLSVDVISSETIVKPVYNSKNDIRFEIQINNIVNLQEYHPRSAQLRDEEEMKLLDKAVTGVILQECESAWNKLMKEQRADVLGFGNQLRSAHPELSGWLDDNWENALPNVKFEISVINRFE